MQRLNLGLRLVPVLLLLTSCRTDPPSGSAPDTPPVPRGDRLPTAALPKQAPTTDELAQALEINTWHFDLPSSPGNTMNRCVLELRQPGKPTRTLTSQVTAAPTPVPARTFALMMRPAANGDVSGKEVNLTLIDSTFCLHTTCDNPFFDCRGWSPRPQAERQSDGSYVLAWIEPRNGGQRTPSPIQETVALVLTIREEAMNPPKPLRQAYARP